MSITFKETKRGMSITAKGKGAQALFDAMTKPQVRPACAVRGQLEHNAMCGSVAVGGKECSSVDVCVHQVVTEGGAA